MRTFLKNLEVPRDPSRKGDISSLTGELESLISRFDPKVRPALARHAAASPRFADLAGVFPGAAYALASRRGSVDARRKALDLVEEGAPLKDVSRVLGLPLWLRRLPPEAFRGPLGRVPGSELLSRRIVNHLPRTPSESALWLGAVRFGAMACNEYFALWLADQTIYQDPGEPEALFAMLAAYAWYSGAGETAAHNLIVVPWRPEMAIDTALCAAKSWLNRIRLSLQLREGAITDTWLAGGEAAGFTFQPLLETQQILAESRAMHNCADQYADRLARDRCRLFSVRRKGQRAATLEIGPHPREAGMLTVTQLKGRHNMPASSEVWQAAYAWLASQQSLRRLPSLMPPELPLDAGVWTSLMQPYRSARNGAAWLPETPAPSAFATLDSSLADLARRAGVSSWLFT
jgi:hypothetical protein